MRLKENAVFSGLQLWHLFDHFIERQQAVSLTAMKAEGHLGRPMPSKRGKPIQQTMFDYVAGSLNRVFSLLVPRDWSRTTLLDIINTPERQDELVQTYIDSEIAKMNTTGVTVRQPSAAP